MIYTRHWDAIEFLTDGTVVEGTNSMVYAVNSAFGTMFGLDIRMNGFGSDIRLIDKYIASTCVNPDEFLESMVYARTCGHTVRGELFCLTDGRSVERDCMYVHDNDGVFEGFVWQYTDVSEREALSAVLKDVTSIQNAIIQASSDAILIVDAEGIVVDINIAAKKMLAVDVIPVKMDISELFPPTLRITSMERLTRVRLNSQPQEMIEFNDTVVRKSDGSYISVSMGAAPVAIANTTLLAVFLRDISDIRAWEIRLGVQEEMARSIARASIHLMNIENEGDAVGEALQSMGWSSRVDRVYLTEVKHCSTSHAYHYTLTHEWNAPGVKGRKGGENTVNTLWPESFSRWVSLLSSGLPVTGVVDEFPESEAEVFRARGVYSILAIPMIHDGKWCGVLGFECSQDRAWTTHEINMLHSMATILQISIRQKRGLM